MASEYEEVKARANIAFERNFKGLNYSHVGRKELAIDFATNFSLAENAEQARNIADFENSYFQDEGIATDGELRPLVSKLRQRTLATEAKNAELRKMLKLAISQGCDCWNSGEDGHKYWCFIPKAESALNPGTAAEMDNSRLQKLVKKLEDGRIAPHAYVTDGASRDPECGVEGCRWSWAEHIDSELLEIVMDNSSRCTHELLNEEGYCRACGADCRSGAASTVEPPQSSCKLCAEGHEPGLLGSGTGNYWHRLDNGELHKCDRNWFKGKAARPSEPSACSCNPKPLKGDHWAGCPAEPSAPAFSVQHFVQYIAEEYSWPLERARNFEALVRQYLYRPEPVAGTQVEPCKRCGELSCICPRSPFPPEPVAGTQVEPPEDEVIIGAFCPSITECAAANKCLQDCHNKPHPAIVPGGFPRVAGTASAPQPGTDLARWIWCRFVGIPITEPYDKEFRLLLLKIAAYTDEIKQRESFADVGGSLLHKAGSPPPEGCYCKPGQCMAPVIMGRQMPCRDPEKARGKTRCCENGYFGEEHECRKKQDLAAPSVAGTPAVANCKGCESNSEDYFEHDGCIVEKAVGKEQGRWQQAIYELARKRAIVPDEIDGGGCDSGDPLDLTLTEIGQVICQLENPQDYRKAASNPSLHGSPKCPKCNSMSIHFNGGQNYAECQDCHHYTNGGDFAQFFPAQPLRTPPDATEKTDKIIKFIGEALKLRNMPRTAADLSLLRHAIFDIVNEPQANIESAPREIARKLAFALWNFIREDLYNRSANTSKERKLPENQAVAHQWQWWLTHGSGEHSYDKEACLAELERHLHSAGGEIMKFEPVKCPDCGSPTIPQMACTNNNCCQAFDVEADLGWRPLASGLPKPVYGDEGEPPIISDDVLIFFPGGDCQIEVANYDHEKKTWQLVAHGFNEPDCDPTHWRELPEPPVAAQPEPGK